MHFLTEQLSIPPLKIIMFNFFLFLFCLFSSFLLIHCHCFFLINLRALNTRLQYKLNEKIFPGKRRKFTKHSVEGAGIFSCFKVHRGMLSKKDYEKLNALFMLRHCKIEGRNIAGGTMERSVLSSSLHYDEKRKTTFMYEARYFITFSGILFFRVRDILCTCCS